MTSLLAILLIIVILILQVIWVGFTSSLLLTSRYQLKRQAQNGDAKAKAIYALTADGRQIHIALLIAMVSSIVVMTLLLENLMLSLFAAIFAVVLTTLGGLLLPFLYAEKLGLNITAKLAPYAAKLLFVMRPVTKFIASRVDVALGKKSLLYSKEQLVRITDDASKNQLGDISPDEARIMKHALLFGTIKIKDIMIPRKVVTMVSDSEQMGPLVMDELHKSGHSRFPVTSSASTDTIVGTLYLHDLVGGKKSGSVGSLMSPKVYFVHEELDLNHALDAFIKTKHHLFVVVNNFEEYVGILTIEDVVEQVLGRQIVDEFDNYENLREVAALRAHKERVKKQAQTDKNVIQ